MHFFCSRQLLHAAVSKGNGIIIFTYDTAAAIVFRAIENFKQAKADLNQFNMNKAEISDDSRLFKIQGDLNLIDHEINAVSSSSTDSLQ
jgi:hypothetical protein